MPHSCWVTQCKSIGNQSGEKRVSKLATFHQFTRDTGLQKKWIHAIRREEGKRFMINCHTTICSRHFMDDCFIWTGLLKKRRTLELISVPSLFAWNDWGKQLPTPRQPLQRHNCPPQLSPSPPSMCSLSTLTPSTSSFNKENNERSENTDINIFNTHNCRREQAANSSNFAQLEAKVAELQKQNESLQKENATLNATSVVLKENITGLKKILPREFHK